MKIELRPLQGSSPGYYLLLAGLVLVAVVGLAAVWYMEHYGHIVTGMNNQIVWGLPHVFAVFLVVAALLIAALAVLLVPDSQSPLRGADTPVSAPVGPLLEVTPSAVKAPEPISAPVPVVVANTPATTPAASAPATMASVPPPARVASAVAASVSAPRPAVGPEVIAFKAKSSAWVRVTDAKGVVQFEKTLAAGEAASVAGSAPFNVVVGNVGATDVSVRGQPFALDAYAKDNVARFEVK